MSDIWWQGDRIQIKPWGRLKHPYMGGGGTGQPGVEITHIPTGIVITCDAHESQLRNKEEALGELERLLSQLAPAIPTCRTCVHWQKEEGRGEYMTDPEDPDTYEPMEFEFEVRQCTHPKLLFCERPLERDGFAVADGSQYFAGLYTAEDFGCVQHESLEPKEG